MMFLLTFRLNHEPAWRVFFQAAASIKLKTPPPLDPEEPLSDVVTGSLFEEMATRPPEASIRAPNHTVPKPESDAELIAGVSPDA